MLGNFLNLSYKILKLYLINIFKWYTDISYKTFSYKNILYKTFYIKIFHIKLFHIKIFHIKHLKFKIKLKLHNYLQNLNDTQTCHIKIIHIKQ